MIRIEWHDLSNSELRSRLRQHGIDPATVAVAAAYRSHQRTRWPAFIESVLNP